MSEQTKLTKGQMWKIGIAVLVLCWLLLLLEWYVLTLLFGVDFAGIWMVCQIALNILIGLGVDAYYCLRKAYRFGKRVWLAVDDKLPDLDD